MSLYAEWLNAKNEERLATERRRELEDKLMAELHLPEVFEGSKTLNPDGYKVRVTYRMNRRIDADLLQEVAAENGLSEHLGQLFRWKPEINKKEWDAAAPEIVKTLEAAITVTPGRPSFAIEEK